jgi:hypothetical protein
VPRSRAGLGAAWLPAFLALSLVGCGQTSRADAPTGSIEDAGAIEPDVELCDSAPVAQDAASSADVGPALDASTGRITEEEWQRRTAPVEGEHEVDRHVSYGCASQRIAQDFRVIPPVGCRVRPGATRVRDCDVEPFCTRHEQCTAKPFGKCRGSPSARCEYPIARDVCSTASDCTALPNGFCSPIGTQTLCYPTGLCETMPRSCGYRDEECTSDADCTTMACGVCQKRISSVRCEYQDCMSDEDCGEGARCACSPVRTGNVCIPADCQMDTDCGIDRECRLELGCHGMPVAYHCSTPLDTCRTKEECGLDYCVFKGSWQCESKFCPVGP